MPVSVRERPLIAGVNGTPGPLRDRLVAASLSGAKTTTSGLMADYERENEALPSVGQLSAVLDSAGRRVTVIEVTEVRVVRLADVALQHAAPRSP